VTRNDQILIADQLNKRIVLMDRSLSSVRQLALSLSELPCSICLDETRGRLYVGEWGGQHRVLVFDGVVMP